MPISMTPDPSKAAPLVTSPALRALRERYRASAPQFVAAFRELAARLATEPDSAPVIEALRTAAHRLRGTAGSYGFAHASELAADLEDRSGRWLADVGAELPARAAAVSSFADALEVAFATQ